VTDPTALAAGSKSALITMPILSAGDRPRHGDARRLHQPPVERGDNGFGLPAIAGGPAPAAGKQGCVTTDRLGSS